MTENVRAELSLATVCPFCSRGNHVSLTVNGEAHVAPDVLCRHCGAQYLVEVTARVWHVTHVKPPLKNSA